MDTLVQIFNAVELPDLQYKLKEKVQEILTISLSQKLMCRSFDDFLSSTLKYF